MDKDSAASGKSDGQLPSVDDAEAPPRHATTLTASALIIADIIGLGVMSMADAFRQLGWVWGFILCILMLPLNIYVGVLLWDAQVNAYPGGYSMTNLANRTGVRGLGTVTAIVVYSFFFFALGDYILALGMCLEHLYPRVLLSRTIWTAISAVLLLPFCQIRTLNGTRMLLFVNLLSIVVSVGACIYGLVSDGALKARIHSAGGEPVLFAEDITWVSFMSALSKFAFAYVGVNMYPEIICEMIEPRDFPRALYATVPIQLSSFLSVGIVGYAYLGTGARGLLISGLRVGSPLVKLAALGLFVHLLITYLIKGTVVARAVHRWVDPASVNDAGWHGTLVWLAITSAILLVCFGVASGVPFFEELTSLLGSVQTPVAGFVLPVAVYWFGCRALGRELPATELAILVAILVFGTLFTVLGTTANVINIVKAWKMEEEGKVPEVKAWRVNALMLFRRRLLKVSPLFGHSFSNWMRSSFGLAFGGGEDAQVVTNLALQAMHAADDGLGALTSLAQDVASGVATQTEYALQPGIL